jgi:catechol 2,3-dioxygenase-like lactoylglutathione lyase family enzyme
MSRFPAPREGIVLTHFVVSDDVDRSRRFYTDVLGGETVREGERTSGLCRLERGSSRRRPTTPGGT